MREKISKQDDADQKDEIAGKLDNMQYNQNQLKNQNEYQLMRQIEKLDNNKNVSQDPVYE